MGRGFVLYATESGGSGRAGIQCQGDRPGLPIIRRSRAGEVGGVKPNIDPFDHSRRRRKTTLLEGGICCGVTSRN